MISGNMQVTLESSGPEMVSCVKRMARNLEEAGRRDRGVKRTDL